MKKIFKKPIVLLLLIASFLAYSQELSLKADFGGKQCDRGRGLCSLEEGNENDKSVAIRISRSTSDQLILHIPTSGVAKDKQYRVKQSIVKGDRDASKEFFLVEEKIRLSTRVLRTLGIKSSLKTIEPKSYPMKRVGDEIQVYVKLKKEL